VRLEVERFERLEALRKQVAVEAERDPGRVFPSPAPPRLIIILTISFGIAARLLAPTASTSAAAALDSVLFPVHGFSDEHILSDKRVRLTMALQAKGLAHLPYAQDIIRKTEGSVPTRKDTKSTFELG
jgi:hypothetical protein